MHGNETSAELGHLRTADRGLEPLPMMERCIPVVDRRMIATERDLKIIALGEAYGGSLHFDIEARCSWRAGTGVRSGREAQFAKKTDPGRQGGTEVEYELALLEAAMRVEEGSSSETSRRTM